MTNLYKEAALLTELFIDRGQRDEFVPVAEHAVNELKALCGVLLQVVVKCFPFVKHFTGIARFQLFHPEEHVVQLFEPEPFSFKLHVQFVQIVARVHTVG